jgi:hypothetical protein
MCILSATRAAIAEFVSPRIITASGFSFRNSSSDFLIVSPITEPIELVSTFKK